MNYRIWEVGDLAILVPESGEMKNTISLSRLMEVPAALIVLGLCKEWNSHLILPPLLIFTIHNLVACLVPSILRMGNWPGRSICWQLAYDLLPISCECEVQQSH